MQRDEPQLRDFSSRENVLEDVQEAWSDSDEDEPKPGKEDASGGDEETTEGEDTEAPEILNLYKSRRFKGYLTIFLASVINYNAAATSDEPIDATVIPSNSTQQPYALASVVPADSTQRAYALAVALVSAIVTGMLCVVHLDRYTPLSNVWIRAFQPKSHVETFIILFLNIWWWVATIVQTSFRGIAGDGKEQYNLYYSTWVCCWTALWCLERKMIDFGFPSFHSFVMSWPYRAPGWIAIFITCFFTLWWYVDLFNNTVQNPSRIPPQLLAQYDLIARSQYQWLIFVAGITLLPSSIFILVEIFRQTNDDLKTSGETILEGFCLFLLTLGWIPSVIVATTPGGFASQVGNAYFFTWGTTVFVLETFSWYIHDWRENVHKSLKEKEREYRDHQLQVLNAAIEKGHEDSEPPLENQENQETGPSRSAESFDLDSDLGDNENEVDNDDQPRYETDGYFDQPEPKTSDSTSKSSVKEVTDELLGVVLE